MTDPAGAPGATTPMGAAPDVRPVLRALVARWEAEATRADSRGNMPTALALDGCAADLRKLLGSSAAPSVEASNVLPCPFCGGTRTKVEKVRVVALWEQT